MTELVDLFGWAEHARDAGMQQAAQHADEVEPGWSERAYTFLIGYARTHSDFISEDVSDAAIAAGEPQPPTLRAWGQIYRRAAKNDAILMTGMGRSRRRNASVCPRWSSLIYKGRAA
ncbi:hypothetical protein QIH87_50165 (plasmid) [Bradyrhizobium elkanii]|uniref:hypothetical protein n=1 Tax=Bradyrhizobium elkanii TaxID=29448 RepID=UPI00271470B1|nr:hypothetical protein [Bradyrhizobium elkanii]WLA80343.1 hypothetical protein QNJ99_33905 [Bradyrhizobium elkanii]WLB14798.1 hypothetical protein QIH87_50165 [Bradyrhizobium elkanii]WLB69111.1 hypothetical protein QIH89_27755 [Bradyrhizobium elkanii]